MKQITRKESIIPSRITNALHLITFRFDQLLLMRIKNFIQGRKNLNDYSVPNFTAFFKQALFHYQDLQQLTQLSIPFPNYTQVAVKLDTESFSLYESLPTGSRSPLIERILSSYLDFLSSQ